MQVEVTEKERKLLDLLRKVAFGQVVIFQENNQPIRIEMIKESVKI